MKEPLPPRPPPWYRRPHFWVFLGAFALRLAVLARFAATPYFLQQMGDMKFYDAWAQRILGGQWTDGHAFYGLPGYAFLLAAVYKTVGADSLARIFCITILQAFVEAINTVLTFKIANRLCSHENRRFPVFPLFAALAWATFVPAQTFSAILMPACWLVCAYWFLVSQTLRPDPITPQRSLLLGLLIGATSMLVATITFALPLLITRILQASPSSSTPLKSRLTALALLLAGALAGAAPATLHNYLLAHDPVLLSAHSGLNFWMGNSPGANGYPKIPSGLRPSQEGLLKDSILWAERAAGHPLKRSEVSLYWSAQANRYISTYPQAWLRLMAVKFRNFWNAFQYDDLSIITLVRERGVLWPGLSWGIVATFGLAGGILGLIRGGPARWVAAAVLLHMLAIMPVFVTERYRLAAVPGLLALGVYALHTAREALLASRWKLAASVALLSLGASWFVSLSTVDPALWSLDPFNIGVKELTVAEAFLDSGDAHRAAAEAELTLAERHLATAYRLVQGDPGIVFAIGNLWLDKGDPARATAFYRRTLLLNPHFAGALNNLGYLATEEKRWPAAEAFLTEAIKNDPDNARSHYLLALTQEALNRPEAAKASIAEALRLNPTQPLFQALKDRLESPR